MGADRQEKEGGGYLDTVVGVVPNNKSRTPGSGSGSRWGGTHSHSHSKSMVIENSSALLSDLTADRETTVAGQWMSTSSSIDGNSKARARLSVPKSPRFMEDGTRVTTPSSPVPSDF